MNAILNRLATRLTKQSVPAGFDAQPKKLAPFLPYEGVLLKNRPLFLMSDQSLGVMWEVSTIAHEAVSNSELSHKLDVLAQIVQIKSHCDTYFQFIYDSAPCKTFEKPHWFESPQTFEQRVIKYRIEQMEKEVHNTAIDDLRLMSRKVYLALRVSKKNAGTTKDRAADAELKHESAHLAELESEIDTLATEIESLLMRAGLSFSIANAETFLRNVKPLFHDDVACEGSQFFRPAATRLADSIADDFVSLELDKVRLATESWQTLSLREAPQEVFDGMSARLLKIKSPVRVVVNLRNVEAKDELTKKEYFLRNARDAVSERQQTDVKGTLERLAYGEKLMAFSFHVLVRHDSASSNRFSFERTRRNLENTLGLPLVSEHYASPLVFWSCLPFCFGSEIAQLVSREQKLLTTRIASLLPLYCGFKGTGGKLKTQVLQNRAGEPFFLSMRASDTSAHLAILASSGAGKSFLCANTIVSERAANTKDGGPLTFIIDKHTSYEILAATCGEKNGFQIIKPPASFPNLFKGDLDNEGERLLCIVNVLKSAIALTSLGENVDAIKTSVLSTAIQKTFEDLSLDAVSSFNNETNLIAARQGHSRTAPRLSEVVDNLVSVCERAGFDTLHAKWLRDRLSPFYGNGPYANLFDQIETVSFENPTPSVSLYDLEGVSGDKVLATLTALIIISDIVRQIKRADNRGRSIQLVIDEAGVIGSDSPEIANFIEDAWKTFRKLGVMGVGLTNTVADFKYKPGPRTIWAVSPNKIVLRMTTSELDDAFKETKDAPALLKGELEKQLIGSLVKKDGVYSQGVFISETHVGTFHYKPTGYDYWLAASKPEEVATVHSLAAAIKHLSARYEKSVAYLAENFPRGVRNPATNEVRGLSQIEIDEIAGSLKTEDDDV